MFLQGYGGKGTTDLNKKCLPNGCQLHPQLFDVAVQKELLKEIRSCILQAPLFTPVMPRSGRPFSVRMTNCGTLGWVSDKTGGYRYERMHPVTGKPWPLIPERLLELWQRLTAFETPPQACLVNYYAQSARMGLHRDEDENDVSAPILSVSLGDSAIFRIGGLQRRDPTRSIKLHSGDVLVMGGESRLRYHGIDRLLPDSSALLEERGRINLTLRYVGSQTS